MDLIYNKSKDELIYPTFGSVCVYEFAIGVPTSGTYYKYDSVVQSYRYTYIALYDAVNYDVVFFKIKIGQSSAAVAPRPIEPKRDTSGHMEICPE